MVLMYYIKFYLMILDKTSIKKKLQYIHSFDIWKKYIYNLKDIILRNEDRIDGKMTDIRSDKKEKGEDNKIKILSTFFQKL